MNYNFQIMILTSLNRINRLFICNTNDYYVGTVSKVVKGFIELCLWGLINCTFWCLVFSKYRTYSFVDNFS